MITQEALMAMFDYNLETGNFTNRYTRHYKARKGEVAGCTTKQGYISIVIEQKKYKAHRLAFLYMEGSFPEEDTDHINMVRNDNRWCNLRRATTSQNTMNRPIFSNNKTGGTGVFMRQNGKYRVYIDADGKRHNGGTFDTYEKALAKREQMVKEHHGEFGVTQ